MESLEIVPVQSQVILQVLLQVIITLHRLETILAPTQELLTRLFLVIQLLQTQELIHKLLLVFIT